MTIMLTIFEKGSTAQSHFARGQVLSPSWCHMPSKSKQHMHTIPVGNGNVSQQKKVKFISEFRHASLFHVLSHM